MRQPALAWKESPKCAAPGCDGPAPGTNPLCREHLRLLGRAEYAELRFEGDAARLAELLAGAA